MKKCYDKALIEASLKKTRYEAAMKQLLECLFVIQYEKGEFVTSPLNNADLFQIVVEGAIRIYYIRDDGSVCLLTGQWPERLSARGDVAVPEGIRQRLCAGQRRTDLPCAFHQ